MDTLELIDLEHLLTEEPPCEFGHRDTTCDIHITWMIRHCGGSVLVCDTAAEITAERISRPEVSCQRCKLHPRDCWRVISV